jgi:hypothetical protein
MKRTQLSGAHIYNKLLEFLKGEYWKRGFQARL